MRTKPDLAGQGPQASPACARTSGHVRKTALALGIAGAVLLASGASPLAASAATGAGASVSGALKSLASYTIRGGYTTAGIGMRNLGYGTIKIKDVPTKARVKAAFLLWDILGDTPVAAFAHGRLNAQRVAGTLKATGTSPCWSGTLHNYAYAANVTRLVHGNGSYKLSGFASGLTTGVDPWTQSTPPLIEGASLIVIYQRASMAKYLIQIGVGATEAQDGEPLTARISGFTRTRTGNAVTTFIVADAQKPYIDTAAVNGITLRGVHFDGSAPKVGGRSYLHGNLWDNVTVNVRSLVHAGSHQATAQITPGGSDCIVWAGQVLTVN
jgi:hypothetical protein